MPVPSDPLCLCYYFLCQFHKNRQGYYVFKALPTMEAPFSADFLDEPSDFQPSCTPQAVAPAAPNNAESTATTIFTIVFQFFIIFFSSFL